MRTAVPGKMKRKNGGLPETQEMAPAGRELQASLEEGSGESAAEAEEEEDEDAEIRETGDRLVQAGAFTFLSAFSFMISIFSAPPASRPWALSEGK